MPFTARHPAVSSISANGTSSTTDAGSRGVSAGAAAPTSSGTGIDLARCVQRAGSSLAAVSGRCVIALCADESSWRNASRRTVDAKPANGFGRRAHENVVKLQSPATASTAGQVVERRSGASHVCTNVRDRSVPLSREPNAGGAAGSSLSGGVAAATTALAHAGTWSMTRVARW